MTTCSKQKLYFSIAAAAFMLVLFFTVREKYFDSTNSLRPVFHSNFNTRRKLDINNKKAISNLWGFLSFGNKELEVPSKQNVWDLWMNEHPQLTSIGDIYDKCDNQTRNKVGKVVLEPNGKDSVQVISYTNQSYKFDITKATSHMKIYFDGDLLYEYDYDVCEQIELLETPYHCPLHSGKELIIRSETKMPSYIPKGRYTVEVSVKNQDNADIGCTFVEFKTGREENKLKF
ncbi:uncharacterized protein LOC100203559 [Hydra vulgaris]|uniref:uncharacterized protein LOC100203559 n=1 Tax=Hydra vulgaris TaxID=6087 RepID=UPI0002B4D484|nr:phosphatidylglycerol/phosphatidylinositol transfer protein [Hydra vulgaris]